MFDFFSYYLGWKYCMSVFRFVCLFVSETGFLCVALAVLELTLWTRLAWNLEIHLPLPPKCWDQRHAPPLPGIPSTFYP